MQGAALYLMMVMMMTIVPPVLLYSGAVGGKAYNDSFLHLHLHFRKKKKNLPDFHHEIRRANILRPHLWTGKLVFHKQPVGVLGLAERH